MNTDESWLRYVQNPAPILSVYSDVPKLDDVQLIEINLHEDGPVLSLRLDLNSFPMNPPQKWADNKFNRVQLTLMLIGIIELEIRDWRTKNIGKVNLGQCGRGVRLVFSGVGTQVDVLAECVRIDKVSAYQVSER